MVDKPRRRKKTGPRKAKLAAVAMAVIIVGGIGWYAFTVYSAKPCADQTAKYATVTVGYANGTSVGSFEMKLFQACAPRTVANFVSLADNGFFDNLTWHRIEKNFVVQTGDPNTRNGAGNRSQWGQGNSGTQIPFESSPDLHNYLGYVAMASTAQKVGGTSQWYINIKNNTNLDGNYAVFGVVISGLGVVQEIGDVPTQSVQVSVSPVSYQDEPITPILVTSVLISDNP